MPWQVVTKHPWNKSYEFNGSIQKISAIGSSLLRWFSCSCWFGYRTHNITKLKNGLVKKWSMNFESKSVWWHLKKIFAWISILLSIVFAEHIRFNIYVLNQCLITYIANNEVFKSILELLRKRWYLGSLLERQLECYCHSVPRIYAAKLNEEPKYRILSMCENK